MPAYVICSYDIADPKGYEAYVLVLCRCSRSMGRRSSSSIFRRKRSRVAPRASRSYSSSKPKRRLSAGTTIPSTRGSSKSAWIQQRMDRWFS